MAIWMEGFGDGLDGYIESRERNGSTISAAQNHAHTVEEHQFIFTLNIRMGKTYSVSQLLHGWLEYFCRYTSDLLEFLHTISLDIHGHWTFFVDEKGQKRMDKLTGR